ncbi:MAG: endonuclease III [Candidatus Ryanbacteria bacterium CG10_big_fil_rev_8_21_14_0_10_43_42]|uniref:Endonuclease III n=1 Tax=Candidatus Ryanbacteria bacterium CG10_big_fil_rev_8_21_14_0_10_43_42 TaxID=1974864 RepID=A0A2M8KY21_9BACT|nr:MAG: endonuclease III [Candidatus Ryanbacteria bacterium CG10_big_fil_rev_8_21_14_0_10_43_42]
MNNFQDYKKQWIKKESATETKKRAARIYDILLATYPHSGMMLAYETPVQLLVAVMLSAQCTDKKVNEVTKNLFKKYKTAADFANAQPHIFEKEIYQTGFYKAKTKHIIATAKILEKKFSGILPSSIEDMLVLPGVARKTANVVLGNAYGIVEGIAVDTHVSRIAQRLGLTKHLPPEKIERDLMILFSKKKWFHLTYLFIEHGRALCSSRKPHCDRCPLKKICPSSFV